MDGFDISRMSFSPVCFLRNEKIESEKIMYLNFKIFYRTRLILACIVLGLSLLYLNGGEKTALGGFAVLTLVTVFLCDKLRKGTMPAICDLCGKAGTMKAEYGAGFSNARLVLSCPRCGRVVNKGNDVVELEVEKKDP